MFSSVLFVGQRVGDIIVWNQSQRLQHGPKWAMTDQITGASFLLSRRNQEKMGEDEKTQNVSKCQNYRPIGALSGKATRQIVDSTVDAAEGCGGEISKNF